MPAQQNLRATGDRIEILLEELQANSDPRSIDRAEELLRLVSDLYGAGFARVVEIAHAHDPRLIDVFVADELVASLMLVLGLHPDSLESRVEAALEGVRPFLAQHEGNVELLAIDAEAGAVTLRLLGSCDGCPSSAATLQGAVERAIVEAAPEIVRIEVDQPPKPVPAVSVTMGSKPIYQECPSEVVPA